jgi:hypothetical protein
MLSWLELGTEMDVLFAADYFPQQRVAYRGLGILTVLYAG